MLLYPYLCLPEGGLDLPVLLKLYGVKVFRLHMINFRMDSLLIAAA